MSAGTLQALVLLVAATGCDTNFADACVPDVWPADVDCLGGTGNGPYYPDRKGPFQVVGVDRYDLDRDHDGLACEPPPNGDY